MRMEIPPAPAGPKKIVDFKIDARGRQFYKVKWESTWESAETMRAHQHLVDEFWSFSYYMTPTQRKVKEKLCNGEMRKVPCAGYQGNLQKVSHVVTAGVEQLIDHWASSSGGKENLVPSTYKLDMDAPVAPPYLPLLLPPPLPSLPSPHPMLPLSVSVLSPPRKLVKYASQTVSIVSPPRMLVKYARQTPIICERQTPIICERQTPIIRERQTLIECKKPTPIECERPTPIKCKRPTLCEYQRRSHAKCRRRTPAEGKRETPPKYARHTMQSRQQHTWAPCSSLSQMENLPTPVKTETTSSVSLSSPSSRTPLKNAFIPTNQKNSHTYKLDMDAPVAPSFLSFPPHASLLPSPPLLLPLSVSILSPPHTPVKYARQTSIKCEIQTPAECERISPAKGEGQASLKSKRQTTAKYARHSMQTRQQRASSSCSPLSQLENLQTPVKTETTFSDNSLLPSQRTPPKNTFIPAKQKDSHDVDLATLSERSKGATKSMSDVACVKMIQNFSHPYIRLIIVCKICGKQTLGTYTRNWKQHYLQHLDEETPKEVDEKITPHERKGRKRVCNDLEMEILSANSIGAGKSMSDVACVKMIQNFSHPYIRLIIVCKICGKQRLSKYPGNWKQHYLLHCDEEKPKEVNETITPRIRRGRKQKIKNVTFKQEEFGEICVKLEPVDYL